MSKEKETNNEYLEINLETFLLPGAVIVGAILISLSILHLGNFLSSPVPGQNQVVTQNGTEDSGTPQATANSVVIDGDAVLGNLDTAKVAIVEFSDFNCGFCQRHHQQTVPSIISEMINTGDVVLVYKDFAGTGGETTAQAAAAAECTREQISDNQYFDMISDIYNAQGTKDVSLVTSLASELNISMSNFQSCVDEGRYYGEGTADRDDAIALGVTGTPGFLIGKIGSDGVVTGETLIGAQPFSAFQTVVNKYL